MEASMIIDCSGYSENITDILKLFRQIGWDIYNEQEEVDEKQAKKEQIGVNLFYNNSVEGISFLANTTEQIMLGISINRKLIQGKYTDMAWYIENIIYKFYDIGVRLLSYKLEEYED